MNKCCIAIALGLILSVGSMELTARELHVAVTATDPGAGSKVRPFSTIGQAVSIAQPGDTVIVHAGVYREWVKPVRGGGDEEHRITFRAASGEEVYIKGSERISTWTPEGEGVWRVELPNDFFGDYNPYALKVTGGWLNYGQWHHRGDVYLNGEAFYEKETAGEIKDSPQSWHCEVQDKSTTIRANFGSANPNSELTEINVRESLFFPEITGLKYITVCGFHFEHAATNWAPPAIKLQTGAVGPRMGKHWIIENCTVSYARCAGIILGQAPGVDYSDINAFGDHIVRNNVIRRCGQAGIAGQKGATRSLIEGNLIEDTNYRKEFGGWETAAIKFHNSVDTVIRGNLIRGVYHQKQGAFGIWIDYANQGTRLTGNIIYNTQAAAIFLEMNHGPALVDNNIVVGQGVRTNSEATVFAHNLFVDCEYVYFPDTKRRSSFYEPHTTRSVGRKTGTAQDERWYNNIFIRRGLDDVKEAPGYASDYNIFLEGARKSRFGDEHSIEDLLKTGFALESCDSGVTVTYSLTRELCANQGLWVDAELVGVFETVGQTIEDRHGHPLKVDRDFYGKLFQKPRPGPLAHPQAGLNTIQWSSAHPDLAKHDILIITGEDYPGHKWQETTPVLKALLEGETRFRVKVCDDLRKLKSMDLAVYDGLVMHFKNYDPNVPGREGFDKLVQFVKQSGGLTLVHFACGAFQEFKPEFTALAGRAWNPKLRGHDPHGEFTVNITHHNHPITAGMKDFVIQDELYTCLDGDTPIKVLAAATSKVDHKVYPMAFVLDVGQGKVFHCVLGHDTIALGNPGAAELFRRGTAWTVGLNP